MMGMLAHSLPSGLWIWLSLVSVKEPLKQLHLENPETVRCTVAGTMVEVHGLGGGPLGLFDPHEARVVTKASTTTVQCMRERIGVQSQLRRVS